MKRIFSIVFALALVLAFSLVATTPVAAAQTYYVATTGSDSNDGSSGAPWLTIQHAVSTVAAGDIIMVAAGTYTENVNINKRLTLNGAGSSSNPASNTVITAAAAAVPVVSISASGASASDRLMLSNIRVTGGYGGSGTYENSGIKFVSGASYGSYTTFSNVASVVNQGSGLLARGGTLQDVQVLNCTFSDNGAQGFLASASDLSIADLTITNTNMNHNREGLYIDAGLNGLTLTGGHYNDNYQISDPTDGVGIYITTRVTPPLRHQPHCAERLHCQ